MGTYIEMVENPPSGQTDHLQKIYASNYVTVHTSPTIRPKWSIYYTFFASTGLVALLTRKKRSKQPILGYPCGK